MEWMLIFNIIDSENIEVFCEVTITGKTGVEMEALTGANILV